MRALIDRIWMRALGRRLDRLALGDAGTFARLKALRAEAKVLRLKLDGFALRAERMVAPVSMPVGRTLTGARAERVWRPMFWSGPTSQKSVMALQKARLDGELEIFQDCPFGEWIARQTKGRGAFALSVEVFEFTGRYFSLSLTLPDEQVRATDAQQILSLAAITEMDADCGLTARLNVSHGPDCLQEIKALDRLGEWSVAEFDLTQLDVAGGRIERIWIDLFMENPRMNRLIFSDLVLSWRRRAEV